MSDSKEALRSVLQKFLTPTVRLLIRYGFVYRDAANLLKGEFIKVAREELTHSGQGVNRTRLSAITGLNRNEISQYADKSEFHSTGFVARILGAWENDRRFSDGKGHAKPLQYRGQNNEFSALVRSASSHLNAKSALLELIRSGCARLEAGKVHRSTEVQELTHDVVQTLDLAARDAETILRAALRNIACKRSEHVHMRTEYDNIFVAEIDRVRAWMIEESRELHKRLRALLSECDKDLNPDRPDHSKAGGRIVYGSFSWFDSGESQ